MIKVKRWKESITKTQHPTGPKWWCCGTKLWIIHATQLEKYWVGLTMLQVAVIICMAMTAQMDLLLDLNVPKTPRILNWNGYSDGMDHQQLAVHQTGLVGQSSQILCWNFCLGLQCDQCCDLCGHSAYDSGSAAVQYFYCWMLCQCLGMLDQTEFWIAGQLCVSDRDWWYRFDPILPTTLGLGSSWLAWSSSGFFNSRLFGWFDSGCDYRCFDLVRCHCLLCSGAE